MTVEHDSELDLQMHELKGLLEKSRKLLGIDLDDVLTRTNRMFRKHIGSYEDEVLWHLPSLPEGIFLQEFEKANNEVFHRCGVNPDRWEQVVELLAERFSSPEEQEVLRELKYHFPDIYADIPELKPGAVEFLGALARHNIPFIIITHANKGWTWHKIESTELGKYFNQENVEIVNEDGHKDKAAFLEICAKRNFRPEQIILIEDSLRSIRAAHDAGIVDSVLVTNAEGWAMYTDGEVPEQTQVVDGLLEIPGRLIDKFNI